ncbi:hypothetical protein [Sphingomonas kyeonggiensis]|uniref:Uncharacterized protein n=1 Tax=Sphingomonas kyeonggiensis TaxID=1268553 RepID=A0A7W6JR96_9SPHN|nr:hypothetical protein [Sphingomonas kyeonggiensis]MBB4098065.1 hypothetical protein [Sphingomonas kyeonggiensis]
MSVDVNGLVDQMVTAGRGLAGGVWAQMQSYAIPELKKIAIQVEAIAENHAQYTLQGAEILFDMQIRAAVSVIVAMTSMTLVMVQNAVNAILDAVKDFINTATGFVLV